MPTSWPLDGGFLKFLRGSYGEEPANNRLVSSMEVGPAKVRRRTTAQPRKLTGRMLRTLVDATLFDAFYVTETQSGVEPFWAAHPITNAVMLCRFDPQQTPQYTAVSSAEGELIEIAVALEILP